MVFPRKSAGYCNNMFPIEIVLLIVVSPFSDKPIYDL